ncbi:MAG: hypothetical protein M1829_006191 [Trizodia sp. TS-e1964]|nr:MAG: hypothetical protein M1829_006191 [Trizodia sp. TS-e1964]
MDPQEYPTPYEQAKSLLTATPYGKKRPLLPKHHVVLRLSNEEFKNLMAEVRPSKHRWSSFSYNSATRRFVIQCWDSAWQQTIFQTIATALSVGKHWLPPDIQSTLTVEGPGNPGTKLFSPYNRSRTWAEVWVRGSKKEVKLVVSGIHPENGKKGKADNARLWLEGTDAASVVILASFEEHPVFQWPLGPVDCPTLTEDQHGNQMRHKIFAADYMGAPYGPVNYCSMDWFGTLASATVEMWCRDPLSGMAVRFKGPQDILDPRAYPLSQLHFSDFLDLTPEEDGPIILDWDDCRSSFQSTIKYEAYLRYQYWRKSMAGVH